MGGIARRSYLGATHDMGQSPWSDVTRGSSHQSHLCSHNVRLLRGAEAPAENHARSAIEIRPGGTDVGRQRATRRQRTPRRQRSMRPRAATRLCTLAPPRAQRDGSSHTRPPRAARPRPALARARRHGGARAPHRVCGRARARPAREVVRRSPLAKRILRRRPHAPCGRRESPALHGGG